MGGEAGDYGVMARDYLARARDRLLEGSKAAMFHAAMELRCCVEARQAEYLETQPRFVRKKLQPYRLGETAKVIQKISAGELIFRMTTSSLDEDLGEDTQFHTPVPKALVAYCERKLDALRHAQAAYRAPSDPWWGEMRADLVRHYRMAWVACQGRITMPPRWNRKTGELTPINMHVDSRPGITGDVPMALYRQGTNVRMRVDYLEVPPPDWVCDL